MDCADPLEDNEDLVHVLHLLRSGQKMPPWVNKQDMYADVPEVVTTTCKAAPGGDGRPVFNILMGLPSKGGGTRCYLGILDDVVYILSFFW